MGQIHISLAAEHLFSLFGFLPVSNSLLTSWLALAVLVILSIKATTNMKLVPGYLQSIMELVIEGLLDVFETILHQRAKEFFPLLATFFLFIIFQNWSGILPGVGTIGFHEHNGGFIPLFRAGTADLNTTLALALIAVGVVQYTGITTLRTGYLKRFVNFSTPVNFFIGILEIVQEVSRVLSFSFRLFGNIFAGEVLLVIMAFLMPFLLPVPFLGMELFVGFIQALVFTMLSAVFLSLASTDQGH